MTITSPSTAAGTAVEHPNAALLRRFFAAFGIADRDELARCVTDDFRYHFPGTSAYAGDFYGIDGLLEGVRTVAMTLGRGLNGFELLHVLADDACAVTIHRDYYTGQDNHLDLRYVLYIDIVDGRMSEVWEIPFDHAENDRYVSVQAATLAKMTAAAAG